LIQAFHESQSSSRTKMFWNTNLNFVSWKKQTLGVFANKLRCYLITIKIGQTPYTRCCVCVKLIIVLLLIAHRWWTCAAVAEVRWDKPFAATVSVLCRAAHLIGLPHHIHRIPEIILYIWRFWGIDIGQAHSQTAAVIICIAQLNLKKKIVFIYIAKPIGKCE